MQAIPCLRFDLKSFFRYECTPWTWKGVFWTAISHGLNFEAYNGVCKLIEIEIWDTRSLAFCPYFPGISMVCRDFHCGEPDKLFRLTSSTNQYPLWYQLRDHVLNPGESSDAGQATIVNLKRFLSIWTYFEPIFDDFERFWTFLSKPIVHSRP